MDVAYSQLNDLLTLKAAAINALHDEKTTAMKQASIASIASSELTLTKAELQDTRDELESAKRRIEALERELEESKASAIALETRFNARVSEIQAGVKDKLGVYGDVQAKWEAVVDEQRSSRVATMELEGTISELKSRLRTQKASHKTALEEVKVNAAQEIYSLKQALSRLTAKENKQNA